jgi:hypothetical protein
MIDDIGHVNLETRKFFTRKLCRIQQKRGLQNPYFYLAPKVNKTPWKTRPIESQVSSVAEPMSQWIDFWPQKVVHLCPAYLQASWQLLRDLKQLNHIPVNATIYSADAMSMYTNIDIDHDIETLDKWFTLHTDELPVNFP